MKAITLWQPYASLVACGVKRIETRSWPAPKSLIGQRIAIHAAATTKGIDAIASGEEGGWRYADFGDFDNGDGWQAAYCFRTSDEGTRGDTYLHDLSKNLPGPMPLGAVVASAVLTDCVPMVDLDGSRDALVDSAAHLWLDERNQRLMLWPGLDPTRQIIWQDVCDQRPFGDFAPGRWAWLLDEIAPTTERCPRCWGDPEFFDVEMLRSHTGEIVSSVRIDCELCDGEGSCEPIPATGRQRVWEWTP